MVCAQGMETAVKRLSEVVIEAREITRLPLPPAIAPCFLLSPGLENMRVGFLNVCRSKSAFISAWQIGGIA